MQIRIPVSAFTEKEIEEIKEAIAKSARGENEDNNNY